MLQKFYHERFLAFLIAYSGTKTSCLTLFSGQPGFKGQKGIMGRYGKMGPSGLKGNCKMPRCTSYLVVWELIYYSRFNVLLNE